MATTYARGWEIYYDWDLKSWMYSDTKTIYDDSRPCKRCGKMPTKEGYDACLGYIPHCRAACCGHGVQDKVTIMEDDIIK